MKREFNFLRDPQKETSARNGNELIHVWWDGNFINYAVPQFLHQQIVRVLLTAWMVWQLTRGRIWSPDGRILARIKGRCDDWDFIFPSWSLQGRHRKAMLLHHWCQRTCCETLDSENISNLRAKGNNDLLLQVLKLHKSGWKRSFTPTALAIQWVYFLPEAAESGC